MRFIYNHCSHVLKAHLKEALYGFLTLFFLVYFIATRILNRKAIKPKRSPTPDLEKPASRPVSKFKAPERAPGKWEPVAFKRPAAAPYPEWDIHTTDPIPYRPFRHGPYYITMGLRSMDWDEWIELDNRFPEYHAIKKQRIEERGDKCCMTAPEAYDAAIELLEEL